MISQEFFLFSSPSVSADISLPFDRTSHPHEVRHEDRVPIGNIERPSLFSQNCTSRGAPGPTDRHALGSPALDGHKRSENGGGGVNDDG